MKKILIDTNAYSSFLNGDQEVLNVLSRADITYLSVFVLAELYFGFKGGLKEKLNRELLTRFIDKPTVQILDATAETSEIFSTIKFQLKKSGNPIPVTDVWIASHTIETGAVLITYDEHFNKISGLRLWDNLL